MTLILSHLSRGFVLQVSDRLVTGARPGVAPAPFDLLANKTIIYQARDAIVSMSYTGRAYIGRLTTDDWIAKTLSGADISEKFSVRSGPIPQWWDIGQATRLLLRELSRSEIGAQDAGFELVAVGWQWKNVKRSLEGRYQPVPMAWGLSKPEGARFEKDVKRLPRRWCWKHRFFFDASPRINLNEGERDGLFRRLNEEVARIGALKTSEELADMVERATVDTIRAVSVSNRYVGPNCMGVVIAPPYQSALVRITFFPSEVHTAQLLGKNRSPIAFPAAFSPWIIGRGLMHRPSVYGGGGSWDIPLGPFVVKLSGPNAPGTGLLGAMSSMPRPPRPTS
jgi:hypothetical protein